MGSAFFVPLTLDQSALRPLCLQSEGSRDTNFLFLVLGGKERQSLLYYTGRPRSSHRQPTFDSKVLSWFKLVFALSKQFLNLTEEEKKQSHKVRIIGFPIGIKIHSNTMADEFPPYVPMPSLGHELGLMFGFFSLCLAVMAAYVVIWRGESSSFRFNVAQHLKTGRTREHELSALFFAYARKTAISTPNN